MSDIHAVILKCPPGGQFHFGKIALDVDTSLNETDIIPHSDTLFSAIISTAFKLYGNAGAEAFIDWFEKGELQISSASYCLGLSSYYVYFLPKPHFYDLQTNELDIQAAKSNRKIQFISTKIWQEALLPNSEEWSEKCYVLDNGDRTIKFALHKQVEGMENLVEDIVPSTNFFEINSIPKVAIHKPGQEDSLYFQTNIQIANNLPSKEFGISPNVCFYFLLRHSNEEAYQQLKTVMQVMADEGIGGERSVGCGRLEGIEFIPPEKLKDINRIAQTDSEYRVSLSLINPKPEEFAQLKAYKLLTRGGRRIPFPKSSNEAEYNQKSKLKRVRMIGEGALIQGNVGGQVVDITPEGNHQNPFKRSGLAFSLPINLPKSVQDELFD